MTCESYQESASEFLDGCPDEQRTSEMFLHLGRCDSCRQFFRSAVAIQRGFRELTLPAVPPSLDRRVLSIPAEEHTSAQKAVDIVRRSLRRRFPVPAPAFVALVTCSVVFLGLSLGLLTGTIAPWQEPEREVIPMMTVPTVDVYGVAAPANNPSLHGRRNQ